MLVLVIVLSLLMFLFIWAMWVITEQEYQVQEYEKFILSQSKRIKDLSMTYYYLRMRCVNKVIYRSIKQIPISQINQMFWMYQKHYMCDEDAKRKVEQLILEHMFFDISKDPKFRELWTLEKEELPFSFDPYHTTYRLTLNIAK